MNKDEIEQILEKAGTNRVGNDVGVDVSFSSTFAAVTTFFAGIVITKYSSFNLSINIPTLFLIISTFGFLYATLIYANNSGHLLKGNLLKINKTRVLGNILSEYIGVYFLLLSIPLIINVVSTDLFLKIATVTIDLTGLFLYHLSGFSIMERNYKRYHFVFLIIISSLELSLIVFQFSNILLFEATTIIMILFIFMIAFFAKNETI